ncbi:MAG: ComEC/Rec2 family competence protein [Actinomycetota bacterium]|nr:ComEC/Rec2 family competence protein [Actinomycetota bacterium]MDK1026914.1 ComEC/Rec2 family competence protein [Actinomycetota bacterium]MDK1096425.1 ComEC/Rec2 family competence protein [Actinomycetota bacterium]
MTIAVTTPGRWCLLAAGATWTGVIIGFSSLSIGVGVAVLGLCASVVSRRIAVVVVVVFIAVGVASGATADLRLSAIERAEIPEGHATLTLRIAEEATLRSYERAVAEPLALDGSRWSGPRIAVIGLDAGIPVGSVVVATGHLTPRVARVRDEVVAGVFRVDEVVTVVESSNPIVQIGNAARGRVASVYDGSVRTDGLVRGLLIGDTDLLAARDEEDLRRAGLAHFVAVSGSNVAMFLVAWWFLTAPIAVRPVLRVVGGMIGLAIFAVVTRWEPSVIRASVMAAVPLVGGLVGIPFDPWMALGTAVTLLLLVSGHLAFSVGFQLSVAATAGVLFGVTAASGRTPRWLVIPLFATVGAQVAVAPIILVVFGTIPLAAPIANLIVAPLVTVTTAIGAVAVVAPILKPLVTLGASAILSVASAAAFGPQLAPLEAFGAVATAGAVVWRPTRAIGLAGTVLIVMLAITGSSQWPQAPTMVVLDVGQGDAILFQDPSGQAVLVDGGADPQILDRALRGNGVRRLSLVVVTHGDADHVAGVVELLRAGDAEELWVPEFVPEGSLLLEAVEAATAAGISVRRVAAGDTYATGSIQLAVLGPKRRYAGENDGSVVLWVTAGRTVFIGGDIEAVAQADLPPLRPDVLVVPHHGSSTTDLQWLRRTVGGIAILSYGENRYGHPHPDVVAVLEDAGTEVRHTYIEGDVVVSLTAAP